MLSMASLAAAQVRRAYREREVCLVGADLGLHYVVDDDLRLGQSVKYLRGVARLVIDAHQTDFRHIFLYCCP